MTSYCKKKEFETSLHKYRKVEQTEKYIVWEVYHKDDTFEAWEVWTQNSDGRWRLPKPDDFGRTAFYCLRKEDVKFWKRELMYGRVD